MTKKIKIRVFPDGTVRAESMGIKGKACTDYIKIMEALASAETFESEYTSEYHETEPVSQYQAQEQKQRIMDD
jgi:hypothetical protein